MSEVDTSEKPDPMATEKEDLRNDEAELAGGKRNAFAPFNLSAIL